MSVFRTNFIRLCNANGKTPSNAAFEAGLSKGAPSNWESRDSDPRPDSLLKISNYFGVSPSYLLTEHPEDEPVPTIDNKYAWQFDMQESIKNEPTTNESDEPEDVIQNTKITLTEFDRSEFEQLKDDMLSVIETLKVAAGIQPQIEDEDAVLIEKLHSLPKEKQPIVRKIFNDILSSFAEEGDW